jgi:hypothetical protein
MKVYVIENNAGKVFSTLKMDDPNGNELAGFLNLLSNLTEGDKVTIEVQEMKKNKYYSLSEGYWEDLKS